MTTMTQQLATTGPTGHHLHGPSKLNYYASCPLFTSADREVNEAAEEGTMLHGCMEVIAASVNTSGFKQTFLEAFEQHFETWALEDDQLGYLMYCCGQLDAIVGDLNPDEMAIEERVTLYSPAGAEVHWGTLDLCLMNTKTKIAAVVDYKFGWVPVTPADKNMQGRSYACAALQELAPDIDTVTVVFLQPKLRNRTHHVYRLEDVPKLAHEMAKLIEYVEEAQKNPESVRDKIQAGAHCAYCANCGACTAHARMMATLAPQHMPAGVTPGLFDPAKIRTPEQLTVARYLVTMMEDAFEPIKKAMNEYVRENGDSPEITMPDGTVAKFKRYSRSLDRKLGAATDVADALKELVTMETLMGCATLSLTKVLDAGALSIQETEKARGGKVTKKAAKEHVEHLLSASGVLTQPEGQIEYAKLVLEKPGAKMLKQDLANEY